MGSDRTATPLPAQGAALRQPQDTTAPGTGHGGPRWVVLDVETAGLDPRRDPLLAVAGVGLRQEQDRLLLCPGDSFEAVLQRPWVPGQAVDKANVLVHGIGVQAQSAGEPAPATLQRWQAWLGSSPRLGFHVGFDQAALQRAWADATAATGAGAAPARWRLPWARGGSAGRLAQGGQEHLWLDIEPLCTAADPQGRRGSMDDWLRWWGVSCPARHRAMADAWATAELLQIAWPRVAREAGGTAAGLARWLQQRRWLGG